MTSKKYHDWPEGVAEAAWARGHMTALEMFRVAAWKSVQAMGELTRNSEEDFRKVTQDALKNITHLRGAAVVNVTDPAMWGTWQETAAAAMGHNYEPKSGLMRLHGVGYPMASAILCVLEPGVWPVIDKWAVETVFGLAPSGEQLSTGQWQKAVVYAAYAEHLATVGPRFWPRASTIHELDGEAMKASMPGTRTRPAGVIPSGWETAALPC